MFFLFVVLNQLNGQYTIKPNECNKGKEMVKESSKEPTFHFLPLFNELEERLPTIDGNNRNDKPANIYLPDENGEAIEFSLTLSPVLSPEMQAAYPDFKTYTLAHAANAQMAGRIFVSRYGWEGMAIINGKRIKYEPLDRSNPTLHRCFEWKEKAEYSCQAEIMTDADAETGTSNKNTTILAQPNGYIRRTYDLAIVTTGEFYQHASFGNNNPTQALAARSEYRQFAQYYLQCGVINPFQPSQHALFLHQPDDRYIFVHHFQPIDAGSYCARRQLHHQ